MKLLFRLSVIFLGVTSLIGGVSLIIYNINIINEINNIEIVNLLNNINIIALIVAIVGITLSVTTLIVIESNGLRKYEKILESVDMSNKSISSLSNLNIPNKDELGNLGGKIKGLVNLITSYDELKKSIIQKQSAMINYLLENYSEPVIIIDYNYDIKQVNSAFNRTFHISKSIGENIFEIINFEDYNLKAVSDSYEKQSEEIYFETINQKFKAILNFKRFINERGLQEYILLFNQVEAGKMNIEDDENSFGSYKE